MLQKAIKYHSDNFQLLCATVKQRKRSSMPRSSQRTTCGLFTLRDGSYSSSSWFAKTSNFRGEIRQSYYRNDPVKYDLIEITCRQMIGCDRASQKPLCKSIVCTYRIVASFIHR